MLRARQKSLWLLPWTAPLLQALVRHLGKDGLAGEQHPWPDSLQPWPPRLSGGQVLQPAIWEKGALTEKLKAVVSPRFIDKLFPQTSILLHVALNYFQLLSNPQAARAHGTS